MGGGTGTKEKRPLEVRLTEPGCAILESVKSNPEIYKESDFKQYEICHRCDGHKTSCKKYVEKSPLVKPADVSYEQHVPYQC